MNGKLDRAEVGRNGAEASPDAAAVVLNNLASICHGANIKWWLDLTRPCPQCAGRPDPIEGCNRCNSGGYAPLNRNVGELIALCHSELSEALEGHRKNLPDDKLPHRPMVEVELADCLIRIFDMAAGLNLDLGGAFVEKMHFNQSRKDHQIENRLAPGGKAY